MGPEGPWWDAGDQSLFSLSRGMEKKTNVVDEWGQQSSTYTCVSVHSRAAAGCPLCVEYCFKVPLRKTGTEEVRWSSPTSHGGWWSQNKPKPVSRQLESLRSAWQLLHSGRVCVARYVSFHRRSQSPCQGLAVVVVRINYLGGAPLMEGGDVRFQATTLQPTLPTTCTEFLILSIVCVHTCV